MCKMQKAKDALCLFYENMNVRDHLGDLKHTWENNIKVDLKCNVRNWTGYRIGFMGWLL